MKSNTGNNPQQKEEETELRKKYNDYLKGETDDINAYTEKL